MTDFKFILNALPYSTPFLFVDSILSISENGVIGEYTFKKEEYFYKGHFKDNSVTPGVILTECMAQIGLVCLGIFLTTDKSSENARIALSSTTIDFYKPVFPGETVKVVSEKVYFRFHKLKCKVKMYSMEDELVCEGYISGMVSPSNE